MRTTFTKHDSGAVTVEYDRDEDDGRVSRTFFSRGGYVYEETSNGAYRQVCDALGTRGSTLRAPQDPRRLIDTLRSEYAAMRRQESKQTY